MQPSILLPWLRDGHTAPQDVRKIAAQEFPLLAQYAANRQPRPTRQADFSHVIRQIIAGRQECAAWWQCAPDASKNAKNNTDQLHFIQVLEYFLDFLLACASKPQDARPQNVAEPSATSSGLDAISNRFSTFKMGEIMERDEMETTMLTINSSERLPPVRYEAEDLEDDEELLIASFCPMIGSNNIKSYRKDLWGS